MELRILEALSTEDCAGDPRGRAAPLLHGCAADLEDALGSGLPGPPEVDRGRVPGFELDESWHCAGAALALHWYSSGARQCSGTALVLYWHCSRCQLRRCWYCIGAAMVLRCTTRVQPQQRTGATLALGWDYAAAALVPLLLVPVLDFTSTTLALPSRCIGSPLVLQWCHIGTTLVQHWYTTGIGRVLQW